MTGPESAPLAPGATVGVLGAGQLGRMLAVAAARMGLRMVLFDPAPDPPAAHLAPVVTAAWDDERALAAFAARADVATLEFENAPLHAVETVAAHIPVRPGPRALAVAQDRVTEKRFLREAGVETAPFAAVDDAESLRAALAEIGAPAVLKTRRLGYDGKGQARIAAPEEAASALAAMKGAPAILEGWAPFARELSVIVARGADGSVACYDPGENLHENGVLRRTTVPAAVDAETSARARATARRIVEALDYVGVMGVELFHMADGRLLANEIAPRVHNTGHWTIEACAVDQFAQHLRAVCGWPLGDPVRHADAAMENLLGEEAADWVRIAREPGTALHLYGKSESRPGRKMGHLTRLSPRR